MAGELGEILPRVEHGSPAYPAQGWYMRMPDGKTRFLGDYAMLASAAISRLLERETQHA